MIDRFRFRLRCRGFLRTLRLIDRFWFRCLLRAFGFRRGFRRRAVLYRLRRTFDLRQALGHGLPESFDSVDHPLD